MAATSLAVAFLWLAPGVRLARPFEVFSRRQAGEPPRNILQPNAGIPFP